MTRLIGLGLLAIALAGCAASAGGTGPAAGGAGPQYEPGDPCKGVVPELCAY